MEKLYPSSNYLLQLLRELNIYLPATVSLDIPPKREMKIKEAYGKMYNSQLVIANIVKDIEISHLLGKNEIVIPHLVKEYSMLNYSLKVLADMLKVMKQFDADLNGNVSNLLNSFRIKEISSMLYSDLKYLADVFKIEIDLKHWMDEFKTYKPSIEFSKTVTGEY